jgi:hypothetical protein
MRKLCVAGLLAAAMTTSACGQSRNESGGSLVDRNYEVGDFQEVEVAGPFDVTIRTGASPSVRARGNEKLLERLVVEVKDGKLRIHPRKEHGWFGGWHVSGKGEIAVTVPSLRAASLAGSGGINIDKVQGDRFEGQIAGSGDLRVASVDVANLKLGIAGSGGVHVGGKARLAEYEIAGAGDVDAESLASETLKVSIAGSGNITAHATGTADVDIVGSGDVEVTGGAKCNVSKAGSGEVRCS